MNCNEIKTNELEVSSYDEYRRYGVDWVTEYVYTSENNLTLDQFQAIVGNVYGEISYMKKVLTFGNGKKLYKHICKAVMY